MSTAPRLSIVIICWNDSACLRQCLESIYRYNCRFPFEVIVTDNNSTDDSVEMVRYQFPAVRIVENGRNLGFGGGNNAAFRVAEGEYILILNPDTLIHENTLDSLLQYAIDHPECGGIGCRVLNPDGTYQRSAYPIPTVSTCLVAAMYCRWLGALSRRFLSDIYVGWAGDSDREIGFQAACCLLVRRGILRELEGFDERLFHQFEDADLCLRIRQAGFKVAYFAGASITHIGGQNRGTYPPKVILETHRSRYRYFYKHFGHVGVNRIRIVMLLGLTLRWLGYSLLARFRSNSDEVGERLSAIRILLRWHWQMRPSAFIESGAEPEVGFAPLASPPDMRKRPLAPPVVR